MAAELTEAELAWRDGYNAAWRELIPEIRRLRAAVDAVLDVRRGGGNDDR